MRFANVVQKLVDTKRVDGTGNPIGPTIPYFKFSDFQRAISTCTDPTGLILICANPADAIPHCIAHTSLLGLSAALLNDEVRHYQQQQQQVLQSTSSSSSLQRQQQQQQTFSSATSSPNDRGLFLAGGGLGKSGAASVGGGGTVATSTTTTATTNPYDISERSVLDVSAVKAATGQQILDAVVRAAKSGTWLILPEVSVIPLSVWTEIGRLFAAASAAAAQRKANEEEEYMLLGGGGGGRGRTGGPGINDNSQIINNNSMQMAMLDEESISPHFRFVTFLTDKSAALGRTLAAKVTNNINVIDTRGVVRHQQELSALFSSTVPLTSKQLSLLCVGIGDGRGGGGASESSLSAGGGASSSSPSASPAEGISSTSFGTMSLPINNKNQQSSSSSGGGMMMTMTAKSNKPASTTTSAATGPPPSFFVDWPCAAAYARAPVTIHSTDPSTTTDFVDAALFAMRETLLRALKDLIATATRLDEKQAKARKAAIEARAMRTQQDVSELEQIAEMRQIHAETHMSTLEKNPGWIYPYIYDWVVSCAPVVNLEKIPTVAAEELTIEDVVWLHEGVGDATACLRGTWQLSPVCIKCALPSVRPDVTRTLNSKLIIEGRTLMAIRHPCVIAAYALVELPQELSSVQGANMVLRPLLSAAAMHERWLDEQQNNLNDDDNDDIGGGGGGDNNSGNKNNNKNKNGGSDEQQQRREEEQQRRAARQQEARAQAEQQQRNFSTDPSSVGCQSGVRQFALVVEPFEMSLEQCLVSSFDKSRPWTVTQMLDAGVAILRALVHISDNYVHRCVCPGNVVITHGANLMNEVVSKQAAAAVKLTCKLTQFSAAMPANRRATPPWLVATLPSRVPVRYCAPETFWGHFTPASDIWSFGVTMWTMLHYCRKQPYETPGVDSAGSVSEGVASGQLRLRPLGDHLPAFFWYNIIEPCLQPRAAERPDARGLISTIMLIKVQHKACLQDPVEFEEFGF